MCVCAGLCYKGVWRGGRPGAGRPACSAADGHRPPWRACVPSSPQNCAVMRDAVWGRLCRRRPPAPLSGLGSAALFRPVCNRVAAPHPAASVQPSCRSPTRLAPVQREANHLVEEFMLLANMTTARMVAEAWPDR